MITLDDSATREFCTVMAERLGLNLHEITDITGESLPNGGEWIIYTGKVQVDRGFVTDCLLEAAKRIDPGIASAVDALRVEEDE